MTGYLSESPADGASGDIEFVRVYGGATLRLVNSSGTVIIYTLISDNTTTRYYRTTNSSSGTTSETTGWFYDQNTGLSQAQAYAASGTQP